MTAKVSNQAVTRYNRAVQLHGQGDIAGAVLAYEDATRINPRFAEAWSNLGNAYRQLGRRDDALRAYEAAIRAKPNFAAVYCNLGVLLIELERYDEATRTLETAIRLAPQMPEAYANLGQALRRDRRYEASIAASRKAIALRPDYRDAYLNVAVAALQIDALDDALLANQRALEIDPSCAQAYCNLAGALHALARYDEAIAACERAIALNPDYAEAHANRALSLLLTGDFARGWPEFAWTWRVPAKRASYPYLDRFPLWDGGSFPGRRLLVTREQGFGDAIQMVRFLPAVKARGGTVVLEASPALARLFSNLPGVDELRIVEDFSLPRSDVDLHIPLLGLPRALGTDGSSIPSACPYLYADPARIERWRSRLAAEGRFRIGCAWAGSAGHVDDRHRSCRIEDFARLAEVEGVAWFSLQKGRDEERRGVEGAAFEPLGPEIGDFGDTAAIVSHLDLVIAVDTSIVHLAGALGKPVWTLLPFVPDWRWLVAGEGTPWYPTMRLFRQPRAGDWASVFAEVARELRALV
ncbi:MAG TPA: tetratricopeptide repeat-containing glycosyltransferase family protein [Candidatus Binatia bacterium]|nr:tetratricopeptide repeat-containing glycosyltransferase family protein [Candidatus Binatia bacterium]